MKLLCIHVASCQKNKTLSAAYLLRQNSSLLTSISLPQYIRCKENQQQQIENKYKVTQTSNKVLGLVRRFWKKCGDGFVKLGNKMVWWSSSNWGMEFVAGGLGGLAGVVAGHPLDSVRVRQQQHLRGGSAVGILRHMVATQGLSALFRGMGAPMASISFQNAMVFQTYAVLSRVLDRSSVLPEDPPSLGAVLVAGTCTGLLQSLLISPAELLKIRLQLQDKACSDNKNPDSRKGPMSLAKSILKTEGVRGIFRGLSITALRDSPSYGVYFWSYEYTKELLHPGCRKTGEESLQTMLAAGGVAGVSSWIGCYPLDVLKTRLQAQLPCSETTKYAGIVDCYNKSVRGEGYGVLWRGLGTTVSRAFVVNGAVFAAYEFAMRALFQNQVK
uniref:Uncharacterized protein n=1 Tax=Kalanchoe fedtschenkoi TaxID=63787 RepID=A0A7N0UZU0_KALFE